MYNILRQDSLRHTESSVPFLLRMFIDRDIAENLKLLADEFAYTVAYELKKIF